MFCAKCGKEIPAGATFCPSCGAQAGTAPTGPAAAGTVSGIDTLSKDQKAQQYWVERIVAYIIDAILVNVILFVIVALVSIPLLFAGAFTPFALFFGVYSGLSGLILVLYFTFMESSSGASIGKKLFHLKVTSKAGSNPTATEALVRNISKIFWLLLLLDVIVGLALSKGYQQKYTDSLMGTTVVRV